MAGRTAENLLGPGDPLPFELFNAEGGSPFLLIGDHAGAAIPVAMGDMGLSAADRARHIAIDIGVYGLGHALARRLDAPFLHQSYSRLVIDCNRDPAHAEAIPALSDGTVIGDNADLDMAEKAERVRAIHRPYHQAMADLIAARTAAGRETILLSLHSFTPVLSGDVRPWDIGILHWRGRTDFALSILDQLRSIAGVVVGDNEPYAMDATDYTVPLHAFPNGLRYAEIEVRQDLIGDDGGQMLWAERIASAAQGSIA
ncbi:putative N-formylglutamate amidohydrolase [Sphingobium xenophagum]|uniref:N-formylglutamate amidohydrolase n=1 Tax=Sphingobium xenophagum TaxID=121428 RepID=A0ABU1WYJ9_SPHXE|nr:N-formylglutamate amidohydrolase [Sphingobium xenophagum]MDR7154259.1 putative N-formylglutamate amidohydrolase [Sphingobium xenophagum]